MYFSALFLCAYMPVFSADLANKLHVKCSRKISAKLYFFFSAAACISHKSVVTVITLILRDGNRSSDKVTDIAHDCVLCEAGETEGEEYERNKNHHGQKGIHHVLHLVWPQVHVSPIAHHQHDL